MMAQMRRELQMMRTDLKMMRSDGLNFGKILPGAAAGALVAALVLMAGCGNTSSPDAAKAEAAKSTANLPPDTSFDAGSGVFQWPQGQVTIPQGLDYEVVESDTFEGEFSSPAAPILIHHDIGAVAGAWAQKDGAIAFEEREVEGARVWLGLRSRAHGEFEELLSVVTFPDNGCANFFMESNAPEAISVIRSLAESFRPKNTVKAVESCLQREKTTPLIEPSKE